MPPIWRYGLDILHVKIGAKFKDKDLGRVRMVVVDARVGCPLRGADDEETHIVTELLNVVALSYHPRIAVAEARIIACHQFESGIAEVNDR